MDCFYAAVEMRDKPALRHVPIAIGGSSQRRGVIATCNYLARKFGVRSAMATAHALKLCPDLVLVPGRMGLYQEVSQQIRAIFFRYTDKIEPLSLDEAYLDVSECQMFCGSATLIAKDIRRAIWAETGLTASAGVAPCKFVAKIASDENKPDGLCVVTPDTVDEFVRKQSLGNVPGVGKVTLRKLQHLGLFTCNDVRSYPFEQLVAHLGKFGAVLWDRAHGRDDRNLTLHRSRKSIGVERTLAKDIHSADQCEEMLDRLFPKLIDRIYAEEAVERVSALGVKLKFNDFRLTTVECKHSMLDRAYFSRLLHSAYARKVERSIRLVGLHVALTDKSLRGQMSFSFLPTGSE